jgi:hypothetical protein
MVWEECRDYKSVAASQTKASLGPGSTQSNEQDVLVHLCIVPATTSPGAVTLYDGAGGTGIVVFTGGATSVADLKPIWLSLNMRAVNAAANASGPRWLVTTGANVSVLAVGKFK